MGTAFRLHEFHRAIQRGKADSNANETPRKRPGLANLEENPEPTNDWNALIYLFLQAGALLTLPGRRLPEAVSLTWTWTIFGGNFLFPVFVMRQSPNI
jgi:hypothetical protein